MTESRVVTGYHRYLVRPGAMTGTHGDQVVALGCALLLSAVFVLELVTPDAVVGALALLPLAIGEWMLSRWMAGVVMAAGVLLFSITMLLETGNRLTILLVAIPVLVTAGLIRVCAASLYVATAAVQESRREAVSAARGDEPALPTLTRREVEVARLAALAFTAAEIGQQLHIGERTVESHIASTYVKLGIRSRSELIRIATKLG